MRLKALIEQREALAIEARNIDTTARSQRRDWTAAEEARFVQITDPNTGLLAVLESQIQGLERDEDSIRNRNMTHTPYVSNKTFNENFPQKILPTNGVLPEDGQRRYQTHNRIGRLRAFTDDQSAFDSGQWMKAVVSRFSGERDIAAERYCGNIGLDITNAAYEGSGTAGGYTVPAPLSTAIIAVRELVGVSRKVCRVLPATSDTLSIPKRTGGLVVYYPNENQALTDSDKTWGLVALAMQKRACLSYLSQELNEDSIINFVDDLTLEMGHALALQEDNELCNGTGASTYGSVQGLLPAVGSAGVSTAATGHDTWLEMDIADMVTAIGKLPDRYYPYGPAWICSHSFFNQVMARIAFNAGGTTMAEVMSGTGNVRQFLGYPVFLTSKMPVATGVSQKSALFGAFSQAVILGDRGGIRIAKSEDIKFVEDQIALKAVARYDMKVHDPGDASNAGAYIVLSTAA